MNLSSLCQLLHVCTLFVITVDANCARDLIFKNATVFALSDERKTYNNAKADCNSLGGNLYHVERNERETFRKKLEDKYLEGLATVRITSKSRTHHPGSKPGDQHYKFTYKAYVFKTSDVQEKRRFTSNYLTSKNQSDLRSVKLYTGISNAYNLSTKVRFCWFYNGGFRDMVRSKCPGGRDWKPNFELYGGNASSRNVIKIYNYNDRGVTSKLSLTELNHTGLTPNKPKYIFLPDISIFVGKSVAYNSTSFSCQTWTLTYADGKNSRPIKCQSQKAHHVCQLELSASAEEMKCNGNSLIVTLKNVPLLTKYSYNAEVYHNGTKFGTIPNGESSLIIRELFQRTSYKNIQVKVKFSGCDVSHATVTTSGKTGYGTPDEVENAEVENIEPNLCKVTWTYNLPDNQTITFKIEATSSHANQSYSDETYSNEPMETLINASQFGYGKNITIQIHTMTSCGNRSSPVKVSGSCSSAKEPIKIKALVASSDKGRMIGGVVGGVVFGLIVVFATIFKRKVIKWIPTQNCSCLQKNRDSVQDAEMSQGIIPPHETEDNERIHTYVSLHGDDTLPTNDSSSSKNNAVYENVGAFASADGIITANNFEKMYTIEAAKYFSTLKRQFKDIVQQSLRNEALHKVASENKSKNRYKNIYPYDHARVHLNKEEYINASFISGMTGPQHFIATQGPKPNTKIDFWEMIWIQNSPIILMLCNCKENGKVKCEQYWPELNNTETFKNLCVRSYSEKTIGDIVHRILIMSNEETKEERIVTQLQCTGWQDHGVPSTTTSMIKLRKLMDSARTKAIQKGPIVVHCSAGAGRTGTFIAFDNLMEEMKTSKKIDPMKAVLKMRENRKDMIQNELQYIFLHKSLVENYILPDTELSVSEILSNTKKEIEGKANEDFQLLSHPVIASSFRTNSDQNDEFSNQIQVRTNSNHIVKMDDHLIKSCWFSGVFVASSEPNNNKEELFWKMILQQRIELVVSLETMQSKPFTFEEKLVGTLLTYENIRVKVESKETFANEKKQRLVLKSNETTEPPLEVTHLFFRFPENFNPSAFQKLLNEIKQKMQFSAQFKCLIQCKDGNKKTGLFLALANLIEQAKSDRTIDVFRVVKDLRSERPTLLNDRDSYAKCYSLIREYLQSPEANEKENPYQNT